MSTKRNKIVNYRDKVAGAVYASAIGDAMGATTEFMDAKSIQKKFGQVTDIIGGGWLNLEDGKVTDDTEMSICVMDALERSVEVGSGEGYFYQICGQNFSEWLNHGPKDVGNQCAEGIRYFQRYGKQKDMTETKQGNGGLMRGLPCALIGKWDLQLVQNSFTHQNDVCVDTLFAYQRVIKNCIQKDYALTLMSGVKARKMDLKEPTGYIINTYHNALYWATNTCSLEEAIIKAVNDGGDADTIACITGGMVGAMYGYEAIPERWVEKLNPEIKKYLDKFINFCCQI